jgi:hypothetical protein
MAADDNVSDTGYDLSDGEWLTYAELAQRRGIDRQSAFKLAARHRWRRQKGNTGQVRVFVPSAFAEPEDKASDTGYDVSHHLVAFETALTTIREAHAGEVAALREQLAAARAEVDTSQDRVIQADTRAKEAEERAERAHAEAHAAQDAAEALRGGDGGPEGEGAAAPRLGRLAGAVMELGLAQGQAIRSPADSR